MASPMYIPASRRARPGELIQCIFTLQVWIAALILNDGVIIGEEFSMETGDVTVLTLDHGAYYVLEEYKR